jgi:hypothetical protein
VLPRSLLRLNKLFKACPFEGGRIKQDAIKTTVNKIVPHEHKPLEVQVEFRGDGSGMILAAPIRLTFAGSARVSLNRGEDRKGWSEHSVPAAVLQASDFLPRSHELDLF